MKRTLSLLLCLALCLSLVPAALAEVGGLSAPTPTAEATPTPEPTATAEATPTPDPAEELPDEDAEPEPEEDADTGLSAYTQWENPIYASIDFSAYESEPELQLFSVEEELSTYDAVVYTTVDAAAAYVRGQMKGRTVTFSLSFNTTDATFRAGGSPAMSYAEDLASEIFHRAMDHTGVSDEGDSLRFDNPGMTCSINSNNPATGDMTLSYTITKPRVSPAVGYYTSAAQENELKQKLAAILSQLSLTGKSDFEKVRAIYAYICDNVSYDNINPSDYLLKYTAYAAAINGTAVCQGYAALFYRLVLECGIDARVIANDNPSVNHAWNIVELNGKYYDLDATWDETRTENTWQWFLQCHTNFQRAGSHPVIGDYAEAAFTAAYPMSTSDYIGSKTLTLDLSSFDLGKTGGVVYIDGVAYTPTGGTVTLPDVTAKTAVLYYFNDPTAADRHTVYPQSMYVWLLSYDNGAYTATRYAGFDDILKYAGSSMRLTGVKGVRIITSIPRSVKAALTSAAGYNGYTLLECGTKAAWANALGTSPLTVGGTGVFGNYAYNKSTGADPVYKTTDSVVQFTNPLTFTDMAKCVDDLALRPYMILKDPQGVYITLYGGIIYRNVGYMAYQNRDTFSSGTEAYDYIHSIIDYVYPTGYTA